jgi:hypothetical protein
MNLLNCRYPVFEAALQPTERSTAKLNVAQQFFLFVLFIQAEELMQLHI